MNVMEGVFDLVFCASGISFAGISWYPWAKASHYIFKTSLSSSVIRRGLDQMIGELGP